MKQSTLKAVATLCILSVLAVVQVSARALSSERMVINIPFEFSVNGKKLPAGEYTVNRISQTSKAFIIRSRDGEDAAITLTSGSLRAGGDRAAAKLVFNSYGRTYFLSQVWMRNEGNQVQQSRAERRLGRELAGNHMEARQVTLLARRGK